MGHDIVLDLHCDDEGVPYLYVPAELWPAMADCAAAIGVEAVLTLARTVPMASSRRRRSIPISHPAPISRGRVVTTVELRGIADVERGFAKTTPRGSTACWLRAASSPTPP